MQLYLVARAIHAILQYNTRVISDNVNYAVYFTAKFTVLILNHDMRQAKRD